MPGGHSPPSWLVLHHITVRQRQGRGPGGRARRSLPSTVSGVLLNSQIRDVMWAGGLRGDRWDVVTVHAKWAPLYSAAVIPQGSEHFKERREAAFTARLRASLCKATALSPRRAVAQGPRQLLCHGVCHLHLGVRPAVTRRSDFSHVRPCRSWSNDDSGRVWRPVPPGPACAPRCRSSAVASLSRPQMAPFCCSPRCRSSVASGFFVWKPAALFPMETSGASCCSSWNRLQDRFSDTEG